MRKYPLVVAASLAFCTPLQGAQTIRQKLQATVKNYEISEPTFASALAAVASKFRIPLGVELAATAPVLRPVKRSWRRATGAEILAAVVHGEKGYALRMDDGVAHVFRKDLVGQQSNFLNMRLERFSVLNAGAPVAARRVWDVVNPKFQTPKPPTPGPHGTISSMLGSIGGRTFSVHLRDATVRQTLDAIALSSGYPVWIVAFAPGQAFTPTGFRRTVSPTSGKVSPDSDQPAWETLTWGEKPY